MFTDSVIRRNDLPRDAFQLIYDVANRHDGDQREFRKRAQAILKADTDTAVAQRNGIKRTNVGKSDKAKERAYLVKECDALTKKLIIAERGEACERCNIFGSVTIYSAHIKSKGPYARLRFEKQNLLLLCYHDHIEWAHHEPDDFIQWIEQKWPGRLQQLRIMAATAPNLDLKELVIGLRLEVQAL